MSYQPVTLRSILADQTAALDERIMEDLRVNGASPPIFGDSIDAHQNRILSEILALQSDLKILMETQDFQKRVLGKRFRCTDRKVKQAQERIKTLEVEGILIGMSPDLWRVHPETVHRWDGILDPPEKNFC